jgi:hypothetical protein
MTTKDGFLWGLGIGAAAGAVLGVFDSQRSDTHGKKYGLVSVPILATVGGVLGGAVGAIGGAVMSEPQGASAAAQPTLTPTNSTATSST